MEMPEYRPDNWTDFKIDLDFIKEHAKFYIISKEDVSSYAMIWKVKGTNERGWQGVRMKREYDNGQGYYIELEPVYCDVEWKLDKNRNDITSSFLEAIELANLHTI